jgi:HAD superfamily hydrolase (TIGR01549 family)
VFDVGETILDDTREFGAWADWIGVPRHTFSALLGIVVAQGRNNAETFQYFRPGFDLDAERQRREAAGVGERISDAELYPDVRPALAELRARGLWVGIAGNQTTRAGTLLRQLNLPVDDVATSAEWHIAKPDPRFFARVASWAPGQPHEIVYVGDHRDYDVVAARQAGLQSVLIRRGPWGHLWAEDSMTIASARAVISSLAELPDLLSPRPSLDI